MTNYFLSISPPQPFYQCPYYIIHLRTFENSEHRTGQYFNTCRFMYVELEKKAALPNYVYLRSRNRTLALIDSGIQI